MACSHDAGMLLTKITSTNDGRGNVEEKVKYVVLGYSRIVKTVRTSVTRVEWRSQGPFTIHDTWREAMARFIELATKHRSGPVLTEEDIAKIHKAAADAAMGYNTHDLMKRYAKDCNALLKDREELMRERDEALKHNAHLTEQLRIAKEQYVAERFPADAPMGGFLVPTDAPSLGAGE